METIGIRELRQNASDVLRRVALGACITVTDRGRPVARLVPMARRPGPADLIAADEVRLPRRRLRDAPPPVLPTGTLDAAAALASMRSDER